MAQWKMICCFRIVCYFLSPLYLRASFGAAGGVERVGGHTAMYLFKKQIQITIMFFFPFTYHIPCYSLHYKECYLIWGGGKGSLELSIYSSIFLQWYCANYIRSICKRGKKSDPSAFAALLAERGRPGTIYGLLFNITEHGCY